MEVRNITKAATFKNSLHPKLLKRKVTFFVAVILNVFMRQTLTDDFWGLNRNMNCAFPLNFSF